ncbi:MAG: hypothetical protein KKC37_14860, partial [Proteobacteria bacterium]|nr:hypothetical protein [Pseudomonadota bacterium]
TLNLRRGCGFRGAAWSSNVSYHYRWCLGIRGNVARLNAMNRGRLSALARCPGAAALRTRCRNYANSAVRQNNLNVRMQCAFRGARWNSSVAYHYNACLRNRATMAQLRAQYQYRHNALKRCQASGGLRGRCRSYAQSAVRQQAANVRHRCGFTGGQWSANTTAHVHWCLSVRGDAARLNAMARARAAALRRCQTGAAGLRTRCQNYAKASVQQNGLNIRMRCGYRGPQWNSSLSYHFNWCFRNRAAPGRLKAMWQARLAALKRCQAAGGLRARCTRYARSAANYSQMNLRLRCGYRGPTWNTDPRYHFAWCMRGRVPASRLAMLNRQRAGAINRCRTGGGTLRRRCRQYARVSVRQNQDNLRRRCGLRGPRWNSNLNYHYGWCYGNRLPTARLSRIIQRRVRALARCGRPRPSAKKGFTFPRHPIDDYLDWCLGGGSGCGRATANAFCRRQGFARASAFKGPWATPSRTKKLLTNQACTTPTCQGFYFINCVR